MVGAGLGAPLALASAVRARLGSPWALAGAIRAHLGSPLALASVVRARLGSPWAFGGAIRARLGSPWAFAGAVWARLGSPWALAGGVQARPGSPRALASSQVLFGWAVLDLPVTTCCYCNKARLGRSHVLFGLAWSQFAKALRHLSLLAFAVYSPWARRARPGRSQLLFRWACAVWTCSHANRTCLGSPCSVSVAFYSAVRKGCVRFC